MHLKDRVTFSVCWKCDPLQDKAGAKARLGNSQAKETVQEYIAGAETVADDPLTRDYVVVRARLMSAKYVFRHIFLKRLSGFSLKWSDVEATVL